jgi:hypothetical protein
MAQFSVLVPAAGNKCRQQFAFCGKETDVLFAGSRNVFLPSKTARGLK